MKISAGQFLLLGVIGVGAYLLYRSMQNIGYSVNSAIAGPKALYDSTAATLAAEGTALWSVMSYPSKLFSGVGSWFDSSGDSASTSSDDTFWAYPDDPPETSSLIPAGDLFQNDWTAPNGTQFHFGNPDIQDLPSLSTDDDLDWDLGIDSDVDDFDIMASPGSW